MATLDELRDELFRTAERLLERKLTDSEKSRLVDEYNRLSKEGRGSVTDVCYRTLKEVLNIDLNIRILLEKAASVDQVQTAVRNLQMVSARVASDKQSGQSQGEEKRTQSGNDVKRR